MSETTRVLITGASGVLGSAIFSSFRSSSRVEVKGLSHTQKSPDLTPIDITDAGAVKALLDEFKPHWVIHCAAERRPDIAEKDPEAARKLNASAPAYLAQLSASSTSPFTLIYISTDYVFDGSSPPYEVDSPVNPLQFYGKVKREGEEGVLGVGEDKPGCRTVLRLPILYGPTRSPKDSAVNILQEVVQDQSGKTYQMDHWAIRYPTNVLDVAKFLVQLFQVTEGKKGTSDLSQATLSSSKLLPPIIHYTSPEPYTKYEMCLVLASILNLPHKHIVPITEPPNDGVTRPKDCHLSMKVVETDLGMDSLDFEPFDDWWREWLGKASS